MGTTHLADTPSQFPLDESLSFMETLMSYHQSYRSSLCSFQYLGRDSVIYHFLLIFTSILLVIFSCIVFHDAFGVFQLQPLFRLGYHSFSSMPRQSAVVEEGCDYFNGRWLYDEEYRGLNYKEDCPFLDPGFRCQRKGRKDLDYRKWRWQPFGCDLPKGTFFQEGEAVNRTMDTKSAFRSH